MDEERLTSPPQELFNRNELSGPVDVDLRSVA